MYKPKILVTGGDGRFAKVLKEKNLKLNLYFATKKECNILSINSLTKIIKKIKPKIILHTAGLSRPMKIHETDINKSINLNIIGTSNLVKVCNQFKIKIIYFSTSYVYEGLTGNYKETDPVKPFNNLFNLPIFIFCLSGNFFVFISLTFLTFKFLDFAKLYIDWVFPPIFIIPF